MTRTTICPSLRRVRSSCSRATSRRLSAAPGIPRTLSWPLRELTLDFFIAEETLSPLFHFRSGDSTARLWDIQSLTKGGVTSTVLNHASSPDEKAKDITAIDWNVRISFFFFFFLFSFFFIQTLFVCFAPHRVPGPFWRRGLMMGWRESGRRRGS